MSRDALVGGLNAYIDGLEVPAILYVGDSGPLLKGPSLTKHISEQNQTLARLTMPGEEITGGCGIGSSFSARVLALNFMGASTFFLEDLIIRWRNDGQFVPPEPQQVNKICIGFSPEKMHRFFASKGNLSQYALEDGRLVHPANSSVLNDLKPAESDSGGLRVRAYPYSSGYFESIAAEVAASSLERSCVEVGFHSPVDLGTAKATVTALEVLIRALHSPDEGFLEDLWLATGDGEIPDQSWFTRHFPAQSAASRVHHRPLRRTSPIMLYELESLEGIASWLAFCRNAHQVLTALHTHQFGFTPDDRSAVALLAVGWEHVARLYSPDDRPRDAVHRLSCDAFGEDPMIKNLVDLSWHTYLQIKHVSLGGAGRIPLDWDDSPGHRELSDFMYTVLLVISLRAAGMESAASRITSEITYMGWSAGLHDVNRNNPAFG